MKTRLFVGAVLVSATLFGVAAPAGAATYNPDWTRTDAQSYAWHGLKERYVLGGGKFINNDRWDPGCNYSCTSAQEGIDCSGYAAKVFAVPYSISETSYAHPYPTYAFYYVGSDGFGPDGSYPYAGNHYWYSAGDNKKPYWMDLFVWDHRAGGPSDHMGVLRGRNNDGTWMTREARGAAYGVVQVNRSLGDMIRWHYKRVQRADWGQEWL
jgi:hypothetical protein